MKSNISREKNNKAETNEIKNKINKNQLNQKLFFKTSKTDEPPD